ncbi:MAG: S8 family serine peptidase [Verrucomicrobiota bacterium]|nr:S8 family serine peptidase [Verrucomicrobiota bacterium]
MSRFLTILILLSIGLLAGRPLAKVAEAPKTVPLLVQLEGLALVPFYLEQQQAGLGGATLGQAVRRQARRIAAEQDALAKRLETDGVRVTRRHSRLINALRVRIAPGKRAALAKRAGVKRVERLRVYTPLTAKSVPAVGAKTAWGTRTTGFDGAGMRIAVIDSGLDYTHAMFGGAGTKEAYQTNDASKVEDGTFPTDKVGGWDFAGKDYSGEDDVPLPDGDPLDRSGYGHGTHVAGIVGGVGVTKQGQPYDGDYYAGLDYSGFLLKPGVAPKAKLFALKIFGDNALGTTNLVLDALEWCADPNGDNDFSDRMDVANLSLGSTLGLEEKHEAEAEVYTHLTQLGCLIVSGAGNSNNNNFYLAAAPGAERSVLSVGSAKRDGEIYRMAAHSARGPSSPHSLLKPEITAPGELIQSARMGTGTGGAWFSGSSMAVPHVAGAAALAMQAHPEWSATEIKALLLNTAKPMQHKDGSPYPESLAGAGFLDVDQAVTISVTAMADDSDGLTTLSLGALALAKPWEETRQIRVTNHGDAAAQFALSIEETVTETGFGVELPVKQVTVAAQSQALVPVRFHADPAQFDRTGDPLTPAKLNDRARSWVYEVSGKIVLSNDAAKLRVPYHALVRAAATRKTAVSRVSLPARDLVTLELPLEGGSAHPRPLVSVFELAGVSPRNKLLTDAADIAADALAFGVASDYPQTGSVAETTLYFGIANAGPWTNPHSFLYDPHLQIDVDFNGWIDHELASCSNGGLIKDDLTVSGYADDVFLSILIRVPRDELGIADAGYLNVFPPDEYDTVPFNNSVMVLPVPARMLGLNEEKTDFQFRLLNLGAEQYGYPEIDRTQLIRYDVTQPVVHSALGIGGTVMHDANEPVRVAVDRGLAKRKGLRPAVLLLHHMNTGDHKFDIVPLGLNPDDADGDGASDSDELAAGTDPGDPASVFAILPVSRQTALGPEIRWHSVADKSYRVQRATVLGQAFETVSGLLPATPPVNEFIDKNAPKNRELFYRIVKP